ncbi:MAG: sigma-70 family RNA polymerase sigma factor [Bacteroidia bacterium]|nr:sigma-70 family RNA polymerase sigma factor [Bacteroidia bacterium]
MTTNNIIVQIKQDSIHALGEIYKNHRDEFIRWARKYVVYATHDDLKDAFSESIIIFYRNVKKGKVESFNKMYLFTIGRNLLLNDLRRKEKNADLNEDVQREEMQFDPWELERKILDNALNKLGNRSRQLLMLFYYEGKSIPEIKEIMGFETLQAVSNRKTKSKKALIKHIMDTID